MRSKAMAAIMVLLALTGCIKGAVSYDTAPSCYDELEMVQGTWQTTDGSFVNDFFAPDEYCQGSYPHTIRISDYQYKDVVNGWSIQGEVEVDSLNLDVRYHDVMEGISHDYSITNPSDLFGYDPPFASNAAGYMSLYAQELSPSVYKMRTVNDGGGYTWSGTVYDVGNMTVASDGVSSTIEWVDGMIHQVIDGALGPVDCGFETLSSETWSYNLIDASVPTLQPQIERDSPDCSWYTEEGGDTDDTGDTALGESPQPPPDQAYYQNTRPTQWMERAWPAIVANWTATEANKYAAAAVWIADPVNGIPAADQARFQVIVFDMISEYESNPAFKLLMDNMFNYVQSAGGPTQVDQASRRNFVKVLRRIGLDDYNHMGRFHRGGYTSTNSYWSNNR